MIPATFSYAAPSGVRTDRDRATVNLSGDSTRPVRFHGKLRASGLYLRLALRALSGVHWSGERYDAFEWFDDLLDPVVTVHPDRIVVETFTRDAGVYAAVLVERDLFDCDGEVICGSTNVDYSTWMDQAIDDMRSSRETWLTIEAGVEKKPMTSFARRVEVPEGWLGGLLRVQEAMAIPGTRVAVRPIDLLKAIRFLHNTKKTKVSPQALRWEFDPEQPPRMVLEPWEEAIVCKNSTHSYAEKRVIRTWGRGRLRLLEPLLPYGDVIDVYLKGRAQPSFYVTHLPGVRFLLGLSGWTRQSWAGGAAFESSVRRDGRDLQLVEPAIAYLRDAAIASVDDVAAAVGCDWDTARRLLVRLCRRGRVMYDLESRRYRHRELFGEPIDEAKVFSSGGQYQRGLEYVTRRQVEVTSTGPRETRKEKVYWGREGKVVREVVFHDWAAEGSVAGQGVQIVLSEEGKLIFAKCGCEFFRTNILNKGPCEHAVALLEASADRRAGGDSGNEAAFS